MLQEPVVNLTPAGITSSIERTYELMVDVLLAPKHCHKGLGISGLKVLLAGTIVPMHDDCLATASRLSFLTLASV